MPEQCNRCRFWRVEIEGCPPDASYGYCRRRPPTLVEVLVKAKMPPLMYGQQVDEDMTSLDLLSASLLPSTRSDDWCGDFEDSSPAVPI